MPGSAFSSSGACLAGLPPSSLGSGSCWGRSASAGLLLSPPLGWSAPPWLQPGSSVGCLPWLVGLPGGAVACPCGGSFLDPLGALWPPPLPPLPWAFGCGPVPWPPTCAEVAGSSWRVWHPRVLDPGPSHSGCSPAALYYLHHSRTRCCTAGGCSSGSGGSGPRVAGKCDLSGWCPQVVSECLDGVYAVVAPAGNLALLGLASCASPVLWLPPLLRAVALGACCDLSGQALPLGYAVAVASGCPVPCLAAQALLLESGWRAWVGGSGLALWGVGFHCRSVGLCRSPSLAVASASFHDCSWGTLLACEAVWRRPGYTGAAADGAVASARRPRNCW